MLEVNYSSQTVKFLKKTDKVNTRRIVKKIENLKERPITHDSKAIIGTKENLFRIRIGDYRVLYEVDYREKLIGVIKIDKRSKVYQ